MHSSNYDKLHSRNLSNANWLSLIFYMIILNIISGETINSTNDAILRFIIPLLLLVFGVVNAFLLYIFGDNLETVFIPIFENNTFFNSIV